MAISVPALTTVRAALTSTSVGFSSSGSVTSSHAACLMAGNTIRRARLGICLSSPAGEDVYSISAVQDSLRRIVEKAAATQRPMVTQHGRPVAALVEIGEFE